MKDKSKKQENTTRKKKILLLLLLLLLLGVAGGFWSYYNKDTQVVSGLPAEIGTKKMSDKDLKTYANKKVNASQVTLEVYPEISIASDGLEGHLWVHNIPTNRVGQQATLFDENKKEIAQTGLIKPGYQVDTVKLNKKLSAGSHKGTVQLTFYDLKKKKDVGKTSVDVLINVK